MYHFSRFIAINLILIFTASCGLLRLTGNAVTVGGKIARESLDISAKVIETGAKTGGAGIRYAVGKRSVRLEREGNSYFVMARINKKGNVRLLVDTGATDVQISVALAKRLGIKFREEDAIPCTLANGAIVQGSPIVFKSIRIGGITVKKVNGIVLLSQISAHDQGLLGMSFLKHFKFEIDSKRDLLILKSQEK